MKKDLSSIINEVVYSSIFDHVKKLPDSKFAVKNETGKSYLAFALNVESIGGFDAKEKDPDKGQIIEHINSGVIATITTSEGLSKGELVFVPDEGTINEMSEYSLLSERDYLLAYVTEGGYTLTDIEVPFDVIAEYIKSDDTIDDFMRLFADPNEGLVEGETNDDLVKGGGEGDTDTEENNDDGDDNIVGDNNTDGNMGDHNDDTAPFSDGGENGGSGDDDHENYPEDEIENFDSSENDDDTNDDGDDNSPNEKQNESVNELIYDEKTVNEVIRRTFFSNDLDLEVTDEPFNSAFSAYRNLPRFDENRPDGWLNSYLNQCAKEANLELERMDELDFAKLRQEYFDMVSLLAEKIDKDLNLNDTANEFGALYANIISEKAEALGNIDKTVATKIAELNEKWEKTLAQVKASAAEKAGAEYSSRYYPRHEKEVLSAEPETRKEIEDNAQYNLRRLYVDRNQAAKKLFEYGITEIIRSLGKKYESMLEKREKVYKKYQAEIAKYIDDNRKEEIARIKALEEELAQKNKADEVLREQTEKLNNQSAWFEEQRTALKLEMERMENAHKVTQENMKRDYDKKVVEFESRLNKKNEEFDSLFRSYQNLDETKRSEYRSRITQLEEERASWENKANFLVRSNNKINKMGGFIVVAVAVAAFLLGVLFPFLFGPLTWDATSGKRPLPANTEYNPTIEKSIDIVPGDEGAK